MHVWTQNAEYKWREGCLSPSATELNFSFSFLLILEEETKLNRV